MNMTRRHCSPPVGSIDGRILVEQENGDKSHLTSVYWHLGLDTTLCYKFTSETSSSMSGTVEVTYVSLKSIYSIMDSYTFPLVQSQVQCTCDCPGGVSQCPSGLNMCSNVTNCHTYYNPSVQSGGCVLHWLQLSSALCCQLQVSPMSGPVYRAVRLGVPSVMATLRTVLRNQEDEVVDTRMFTVNLNTGASIDWYVNIVISGGGHTPLLTPGWFVTHDSSNPDNSILLTGLSINGLDTWDVTKLGWMKMKTRGGRGYLTHNLEQLSGYFTPTVDNCAGVEVRGHFPGVNIDKTDIGGRHVTQEYPFISRVRIWRRHVELDHSQSPVVSLTLQHRTRVGVTVQQSPSHISSFTGVLYQVK